MKDVIIIGAGVTGCAIARCLSQYELDVLVIEKAEDVCEGTSKANSAIVHAGFDATPGTLMAKMNVRGNELIHLYADTLDIPFKENGALVLCLEEEGLPQLQKLYQQGLDNGVKGLQILTREEVLQMEPNLTDAVVAALYAPTSGIIDPFNLTIAMGENAVENGVQFVFNEKVIGIERKENYQVTTDKNRYEAKVVINAAGVYADEIHNLVAAEKKEIIPRKGEYYLLDKNNAGYVHKTIFTLPSKLGKGVLISPTVDGNIIVGPNANDIEDKSGINTTASGLAEVAQKASIMAKNLPLRSVITSFAGLRAHLPEHDFIIKELEEAPGFIDCLGIESPGLTSCMAIGEMVENLVKEILQPAKKESYKAERKGIKKLSTLSMAEKQQIIQEDPLYGHIICRCEVVSESEIIQACHRPLPAKNLDGLKRRVRATAGRCQGGFCTPQILEIMARELNVKMTDLSKKGPGSELLMKPLAKGGQENA